jgi:general secretion pathway protein D
MTGYGKDEDHMRQLKKRTWMAAAMISMAARAAVSAAPAPTAPGTQPGANPGAATSQPATTRPATTRPTTIPSSLTLTFKDTPIDTVLDFLSRTLGFEVIKDGPLDTRVNITSKQPVSPEEAITLLNAALKGNGFVAIREGRVLRVIPRDKAKKGNVPVHFGSDPEAIADTDELITQVIPIQNVNATKLRDELKGFMSDADAAANDASNSLIITDTSAAVRRIAQIISKLDEHEAQTAEIRIIRLQHANATATAKLIDTFFKAPAGGGQQMTPQMQMQMQMQGGQPPQQHGGSERHGQTVITAADDRTNTLLVMASVNSLKIIDDIVKHVDSDDPNPAPETQMKAFALKYASAEDTAKLITNIFKVQKQNNDDFPFFFNRFGSNDDDKKALKVTASFDQRTNTLIVTSSVEGLKQVEKLVELLDANPLAAAELQVYHLKHASAFNVSSMIEDMFKPKQDSTPRFPFFIFGEGSNQAQSSKVSVNVTSDDRTNTVIVTAPSDLLKVIGKVVEELDADPTTEDTLFIYHLRNAQAQNLEYVLNVLFGNVTGAANQNGQQNGQGQQNQNQQGQGSRFSNNGSSSNSFDSGNSSGGSGSGSSINRSSNRQQGRQQGQANGGNPAKAENELTGKALVVADLDTNALLVTTASKYEKQVRQIIEDLDRPVPQVLIKVLVAEVTHDNSADLGLDFSVLNQRAGGKGQTLTSGFGNAGVTPGVLVSVVESNITATLHVLAEQDKLDVLSRPYILASDNQLANIFIGSRVPFITNSQITEAGQLINTVQYQDIGLNLNVTPHINPDGVVILDVNPEVQQLTAQNVTITNNTNSPVISKRSADSRIAVVDGQTIVIGGMMEDRKTSLVNKIPLLGDIPGLGFLFSRTQVTKTKTELLIFLTPHVAQKPDALRPMAEDEGRGLRLTPNAVQPGAFEEQMKGMRRGELPQTRPAQPVSPVNAIDLSGSSGPRPADPPTTAPSTDSPAAR